MNRTLTMVLLLALTACGEVQEPGSSETPPPAEPLALQVAYEPDPPRSGQPVTWRLILTNVGPEPVRARMPSGQAGDVVLSRDGREVYRWSTDKMFTMALVNVDLAPGQDEIFDLEEESFAVDPGTYELEATTTAEPSAPAVRQEVTVEAG